MKKAVLAALLLLSLLKPAWGDAGSVTAPEHEIVDGMILVSARLDAIPERIVTEIGNGIEKRFEFSVELIREWDNWMDEYIDGVMIVRTIKYDVTKKQYELSSREGRYLYEKSTTNPDEAFRRLTALNRVPLARAGDLPRGTYHVRVRVASRRIQLPALLKIILFFVPEIEFSAESRGPSFPVNK